MYPEFGETDLAKKTLISFSLTLSLSFYSLTLFLINYFLLSLFSGELVFPVLFMYPEFGETDFIEEWRENEAVALHIQVSFKEP